MSAQPDAFTVPADPDPMSYDRKVLFVAGAGRSGTSTMAGLMKIMGLHVPQPEVEPDETNPKGFAEPAWAVEHHSRLLREAVVQVSDSRPDAWFETGRVSTREPERIKTAEWLEGHFAVNPELVVKDPRLAWFMGLWRGAALRCDARPGYVTMLRPVTEVVGSKQRYYDAKFGEVNRTAAWVNMMLHCERATRGSDRAFVRYHDLLDDWTVPVFGLGQRFDLDAVKSAAANDIRKVHAYIDPSLRRVQLTWDDLEVPKRLREIAQETWEALDRLPDEGGDTPEVQATLDQLREAYAELYEEAAAISQSTALASRRDGFGEGVRSTQKRGIERVPHWVRALVPAFLRRGARKVAGRERA